MGQGIRVGEREMTGEFVGGMRLIGDPIVDRADAFSEEQSDTAELPSAAEIRAFLPSGRFDALVAAPGSGVRGWAGRIRAVLGGCGRLLIVVAVLCAGPMHLFADRVADTLVAAPALSDLARGVGLLLLPLMWLSYLALTALPLVLCLAGVAAVVVAWASGGALADFRTVLSATLHRIGPLWAWLAGLDAVVGVRWLIPDESAGPRHGLILAICAAVLAAMLAVPMGVLGCVVLFERGRGLRRAVWLLAESPPGAVAGLGVAGVAVTALPMLADAVAGLLAAALAAVFGALFWAVAALVTYAQARRSEGPLTSAQLRHELSV